MAIMLLGASYRGGIGGSSSSSGRSDDNDSSGGACSGACSSSGKPTDWRLALLLVANGADIFVKHSEVRIFNVICVICYLPVHLCYYYYHYY
jgi:hypothetical protein